MAGNRVVIRFIGEHRDLDKTLSTVRDKLGTLTRATALWGSALAGAAAVAAPAVIGGVALAFAGLGVAIAAQNKQVQASFTQLKTHVMAELTKMAQPFVPVLMQVSKLARVTFDQLRPALTQAFALSAPFVTTLSEGIARLATNLMPGFVSILQAARPTIQALSDGLGGMGFGLARMFQEISTAGGPAGQVFASLLAIVNNLLPVLGRLIAAAATGLAPVFAALVPVVNTLATVVGNILGEAFRQLGPPIAMLITKLTPVINWLLPKIGEVITGIVIPALAGMITWLANNVDTMQDWAMNTVVAATEAAGAFLEFASVTLGVFQRVFAVLSLMPGQFGRNMGAAARATGEAKDSVDHLRGTVDQMHSKAIELRAQVQGQRELDNAMHTVAWFPSVKNVRIQFSTNFGAIGGPSLLAAAHGRAVGGTVNKGRTYLVGERGPELLTMPGSGSVTPNHRIGESTSSRGPQVEFVGNLDQIFATYFMQLVRSGKVRVA
jgi:phage-related protein